MILQIIMCHEIKTRVRILGAPVNIYIVMLITYLTQATSYSSQFRFHRLYFIKRNIECGTFYKSWTIKYLIENDAMPGAAANDEVRMTVRALGLVLKITAALPSYSKETCQQRSTAI